MNKQEFPEIKFAELLIGWDKVNHSNVNPVYKGFIQIEHDDAPISAYFKIIPSRELLVESICTLLGRWLGLPMPEPYLLIMSPETCPPEGNPDLPAFATVDMKQPSFNQRIWENKFSSAEVGKLIKQWSHVVSAATFDEWIGNTDRNAGNLLYDGKNITLIDHDKAINENHRCDIANNGNELFNVLRNDDEVTKRYHVKNSKNEILSYGETPFNMLVAKTFATEYYKNDKNTNNIIDFLRNRIGYLIEHIFYQLDIKNKTSYQINN
ncbi:MAG: HipA family kinase [Methylococcaceae bacterium]